MCLHFDFSVCSCSSIRGQEGCFGRQESVKMINKYSGRFPNLSQNPTGQHQLVEQDQLAAGYDAGFSSTTRKVWNRNYQKVS